MLMCQLVTSVSAVSEEGEKLCIFRDEDDCKYTFIYKLEPDGEYTVRAKNERGERTTTAL